MVIAGEGGGCDVTDDEIFIRIRRKCDEEKIECDDFAETRIKMDRAPVLLKQIVRFASSLGADRASLNTSR